MAGPLDPLVYRTTQLRVGSVNVAVTLNQAIWAPQTSGQIVAGWLSDSAGLTLGTNTYTTIALNKSATGLNTMISINTQTVPITIGTMNPMTLSTTVADTKFAAGDTIYLVKTDTAGGGTYTNAWMQIDWIPGAYN